MNPELRRNLWLEITTHRLLAMPVVLGLAFLALAAIDKPNAAEHVGWLGLGGFVVLTMFWGARLAGNSIIDEITDKTWDWQRLSTLAPWTMTWGKLFGATVFAWYGGLICLGVFMATPMAAKLNSPFKFALSMVLIAIMTHATTIAAALHLCRNGAVAPRRSIGVLPLLLLMYVVPFAMARAWGERDMPRWYGAEFDGLNFLLASSLAFAAWAVLGAYRAMCQSLAVRTTPLVWLAFLAFIVAYAGGLANADAASHGDVTRVRTLAFVGVMAGLLATYVMLFTESTGPLVLRRMRQQIRARQWRRASQEMPCWPVAGLFAVLCAVFFAVSGIGTDAAPRDFAGTVIPWTLLVARDAAIFLFFAAAPQPKRVVGTTLVYMLVLDWILPGVLGAMGFKALAEWVFPIFPGNFPAQCASALLQAVLAGWLAWHRMQTNFSTYRVAAQY